jgi:3-deoxy-manno-octulosonate cytidylyltransferase (CMP-KDO synthetase)
VTAILPARLGSTRLSGKVLRKHLGKPLLYHVWSQVSRSRQVDLVAIATDNREIAQAAKSFGAEVVMTSRRHRTGTDRVAEAAQKTGGQIIINVQADNYGLTAPVLDRVIQQMKHDRSIPVATLARRIKSDEALFDPNLVKLVTDPDGYALWFSRYPLPFLQKATAGKRWAQYKFLGHVGVYFFRKKALDAFASWRRSPLEKAESLEQLRIIENGGRIKVFRTSAQTVSVDTPRDLRKIKSVDR